MGQEVEHGGHALLAVDGEPPHDGPADEHGHELLNIALSSPFGEAHFEAPRSSTAAFLGRTYELIAPGHESEYIDVDDELDELLWRA